jgi:hypothetical protein
VAKKVAAIVALLLLLALGGYLLLDDPAVPEAGTEPSTTAADRVEPPVTTKAPPIRRESEESTSAIPSPLPPQPAKEIEPPPAHAWTLMPDRGDRPLPEKLAGRVLDRSTEKPLSGARVLMAYMARDGGYAGWHGDMSRGSGDFAFEPRSQIAGAVTDPAALATVRVEVRIRKAGYAVRKGPLEDAADARLDPLSGPILPGSVEGVISNPDGGPFEGRIGFETFDGEFGDNAYQWVIAEPGGSYRLEGVAAGPWRLRPRGAKEWMEIVVPSGGTVPANFRLDAKGPFLESLDKETRAVTVSFPSRVPGPECAVRAERFPRHFFRVMVAGGEARFKALPTGTWDFVLQRGGFEETTQRVEVPPGEGTFEVKWTAK